VEWAILDRRPGGELLAVPADASPFAGSADVEVPATAPGGPLCLRCRLGVWLSPGLFEPGLRSGTLAPETVAEARQQVRRLEAGALEPSPLAEEIDADSEYRDWIREVPERARALALAARPAASRKPHPWFGAGYPLAATFALLAIGLGIWVAMLRHEVDRRSMPIFDVPSRNNSIVLGERTRGRSVLEVPPEASYVLLFLFVDSAIPPQVGRFEILNAKRRIVWHTDPMPLTPESEHWLAVERSRLPDGEYSIRIVPAAGGHSLAESKVGIETAKELPGKRDFSPGP
jgi:hypothetical protein